MEKQSSSETRKERFKRLATARTNVVLDRLRVLGNCSNRALYEYSEEEVNRIFAVIEKEMKVAKARFKNSRKRKFEL